MTQAVNYKLTSSGTEVVLIADDRGAIFPCTPGNELYEQYKIWLAEGNKPLPPDEE